MRISLLAFLLAAACGSGSSQPAGDTTEPSPTPAATEPAPAEPVATEPAEPAPPAEPPKIPEPQEAGPDIYKVLVENDTIRMFEATFAVGSEIALHQHPDLVAYAVTGGKLEVTQPGGKPEVFDLTPGMAIFDKAQSHSAKNVGETEIKLVVVELRAGGTAAPEGGDPAKVGPKQYKQVLDHERARVFEVTFAKGAKIKAHAHPDHAVYVLSGGKLEITETGKEPQALELEAGQAVFLPAQVHSAKNLGKTPVKLVVFEIKPTE